MNNKHKVYLKMCDDLTKLSKCAKHKVAALIVKDGRIVSNGVNGTPSGYTNCCDKFNATEIKIEKKNKLEHREWSSVFEVHAEMNAILFAAKRGVNLEKSVLYCNLEPCFNCLKHIISCGIKEIYYTNKHKGNLETEEALSLINTLCIKIQNINI